MSRLYVELWGGPADGRVVRVYESTEEVHVPMERTKYDNEPVQPVSLRYVLNTDTGRFQFRGVVTNGTR